MRYEGLRACTSSRHFFREAFPIFALLGTLVEALITAHRKVSTHKGGQTVI